MDFLTIKNERRKKNRNTVHGEKAKKVCAITNQYSL